MFISFQQEICRQLCTEKLIKHEVWCLGQLWILLPLTLLFQKALCIQKSWNILKCKRGWGKSFQSAAGECTEFTCSEMKMSSLVSTVYLKHLPQSMFSIFKSKATSPSICQYTKRSLIFQNIQKYYWYYIFFSFSSYVQSMAGDDKYDLVLTQDRYPPQTPFFRITFQELLQDSDFFFQGTKFHIKPMISKSILLMIYIHFL